MTLLGRKRGNRLKSSASALLSFTPVQRREDLGKWIKERRVGRHEMLEEDGGEPRTQPELQHDLRIRLALLADAVIIQFDHATDISLARDRPQFRKGAMLDVHQCTKRLVPIPQRAVQVE